MTHRRLGWALLTAVSVLISAGARIGWSLTRPARRVEAGVAESLADSSPAPFITARPASLSAASVPALPAFPITDVRPDAGGRTGPEPIASHEENVAVTAVPETVR